MERPDWYDHDPNYTPYYNPDLPAASREDRVANVLSEAAVKQLLISAISTGKVFALPISTKSGHPKFQQLCLVSNMRTAGGGFRIPAKSIAMQEIEACPYAETYLKNRGRQQTIQFSHIWWRYTNRNSDGSMRMIPCYYEISHDAEAFNYTQAILEYQLKDGEELPEGVLALLSTFKIYSDGVNVFNSPKPGEYEGKKGGGWVYQRVNLESNYWNSLRIICRKRGLANKKSTGEYFEFGEDTDEPSMCPHEEHGCICYSPHPAMSETVENTTSEEPASEEPSGEGAQEEALIDRLTIGRTRISNAHLLTPLSPPSAIHDPMMDMVLNNVPAEGIADEQAIVAATAILDMVVTQGREEHQVSQGVQVERIVPVEFVESDSDLELDSDDELNLACAAECFERFQQYAGASAAARKAARAVPVAAPADGAAAALGRPLFAAFADISAAGGRARLATAGGGNTVPTTGGGRSIPAPAPAGDQSSFDEHAEMVQQEYNKQHPEQRQQQPEISSQMEEEEEKISKASAESMDEDSASEGCTLEESGEYESGTSGFC